MRGPRKFLEFLPFTLNARYTMLRSWRERKKYGIEEALSAVGEKYVRPE